MSETQNPAAEVEKVKKDAEKLIKRTNKSIFQLNQVWWGPVIGSTVEGHDELYLKIFDLVFQAHKVEMEMEVAGEEIVSETDSRTTESDEDADFVPKKKKRSKR